MGLNIVTSLSFSKWDLENLSEALSIAEDKTGDYYKFSFGQWKRHRYDLKTLSNLSQEEIAPDVFALLNKKARRIRGYEPKTKNRDFYFICLQDNRILHAIKRDPDTKLLPLLVYVLTHELVHVVRFCNFEQRFEIALKEREREEKIVHETTYDILKTLSLPNLSHILEFYREHRSFKMDRYWMS